ncbi:MAG: DUF296 domain-containing protein [Candidatus Bathyarchaeota archaeon]|nr:DUF296 domain-containing protein [Candidatus Bathyarchaeota archaeon]
MHSEEEKDHVIVKLDDGEDVFESLNAVVKKHSIDSAVILSGIGMLAELEIGFYNGEEYIKERYSDPMELLSMHGSITGESENKIHIHVGLANSEHNVVGGHLFSAKVRMLNEIVLLRLDEIKLTRALNPKTNLMELKITKGD